MNTEELSDCDKDTDTTGIVVHENAQMPTVVDDSRSMLGMIGKMASSPEVDIDKVERLMALQVQMQNRENEAAFNAAMTRAQSKIGVIIKNKSNTQTSSDYADLGAIVSVITPVYTEEGINLSFDSGKATEDGCLPIMCYVSACGHTRPYNYDSPITDKGIKGTIMMTSAHARGSATSYGRRYLTCMIFNIATADDDGNAATNTPIKRITAEQVADIRSLLEETEANEMLFLKWIKADNIESIQPSAFNNCIKILEKRRK